MAKTKRAALYVRVSTDQQTVENQIQELRQVAASMSVERAAALVTSRMNPEIRSRMFQSFLDKLERGAN